MIKIITATAFQVAIEVDESGKIIKAPKNLSNFLNQPLTFLEQTLKKHKFSNIIIENVEEIDEI
jgi:hypothetical protein